MKVFLTTRQKKSDIRMRCISVVIHDSNQVEEEKPEPDMMNNIIFSVSTKYLTLNLTDPEKHHLPIRPLFVTRESRQMNH